MYKSKSKGITVYQGQLYSLTGSDTTIVREGSKNSPPTKKIVKGATQAVFKYLYELGHKGIYFEEKPKESVKKED
jgi:hypothetical protein